MIGMSVYLFRFLFDYFICRPRQLLLDICQILQFWNLNLVICYMLLVTCYLDS